MSSELLQPENSNNSKRIQLLADIELLKNQLDNINREIHEFETILRNNLTDEIIEIRELTLLYKKLKQTKKAKRLLQKQKGKNYKPKTGLQKTSNNLKEAAHQSDQKELKRLYKEAMWRVHPDKFSMHDGLEEQATILTQQLIEIYQSGDLEQMKAFCSGILEVQPENEKVNLPKYDSITWLEMEKTKLEDAVENARSEHLYRILQEYENPMDYIRELKAYFDDKLFKLRKRTRKAN